MYCLHSYFTAHVVYVVHVMKLMDFSSFNVLYTLTRNLAWGVLSTSMLVIVPEAPLRCVVGQRLANWTGLKQYISMHKNPGTHVTATVVVV